MRHASRESPTPPPRSSNRRRRHRRRRRQPPATSRRRPRPRPCESTRSLFAPTWRQAQISGRWSSVSGDPARFQRYQDLGSGLLFTDARYARETRRLAVPGRRRQRRLARSAVLRHLRADRQVRHLGALGPDSAVLQRRHANAVLARARRRARWSSTTPCSASIQNGQANLNAYMPIATQFDLRERRDIGSVTATATPTREIDVKAAFTTTRHTGELPWGASFGFSNDVEVALPYDSRTNDFTVGAEWTNSRGMVRVAYDGSWFNNLDDTLVWDSPLRLDDSTSAPGRGRMALWPSNSAQTFSAAATRSSRGARRSPDSCPSASGATTSRCSPSPSTRRCRSWRCRGARREAEAHVFSTNINLVSRPVDRLAVQRAAPPLRLRQPDAARGHPAVHQLRHVGERRRRPAARSCSRTAARRSTPTRPGRDCCRWPSRPATRTTAAATISGSSRAPARTC